MVTATPSLPQLPKVGKRQLVNGDSTNFVNAYVGGSNGSKVVALFAVNTDTVSHVVQIAITKSSVNYLLGTVSVGASAGNTAGVAPVNLLNAFSNYFPVDSDGNPYVFLNDNNDALTVSVTSPMAVATALNLVAVGADW